MKKEVINIDWYTKVVLTIIAVCLLVITFKPILISKEVKANPETLKVDIVKVGGYRTYGSVPIEAEETVGVNISEVDTGDILDVNIEEVGGGFVSHGGPIKVEAE